MENTVQYSARILSSLEKVFIDQKPEGGFPGARGAEFTALRNETFSFQVSYTCDGRVCPFGTVRVESPIREYCRIREVRYVPSVRPVNPEFDDHYLRTQPGLYPDLLTELLEAPVSAGQTSGGQVSGGQTSGSPAETGGQVQFWANKQKSLWIDVEIPADGMTGTFPIAVIFSSKEGEEWCRAETTLSIGRTVLKPQKLIHTEWFHGDCLADYYGVPVFSERHWEIMEAFIRTAAERGCNMILTPQFTPPLDTAPGGERTTIQLVDVKVLPDGSYEFGFDRLKRWVEMCQGCGMTYFEMSHLFTQWGAAHAPKIMAEKDGKLQQIFGWDDPAAGGSYTEFLGSYLPQLTKKLKEWGIAEVTRFHISDEPRKEHLTSYKAAKESVAGYLEGFVIMDAISDLEICREGGIDCPVCANNHIAPFLEAGVKPLWGYYCTSQCVDVSNRFMAMPSARNRIFGIQAFLYELEGFLHWGYNFYNSQFSVRRLNPYCTNDADGAFPSGDPFLVYPGKDGKPEESIRLMVLSHMMQDVRAMEQLAEQKGREFVVSLIEDGLEERITFGRYPKSAEWILKVRNRVNEELEAL
ncbi:MAG: DUF4091 domain-containing protein, partial [Lachnospiraceae bacterium]|nr:DUF4091 domain-containing protein [Lachnospiraceae bacterium]